MDEKFNRSKNSLKEMMGTSTGQNPTVIELWVRPQANAGPGAGDEPYRVAIDLQSGPEQVKLWVETIQGGIQHQRRQRSGRALWDSVANRLRFLVQLKTHLGGWDPAPGRKSSDQAAGRFAEDLPIPRSIRDPDSLFSQIWDMLQLVLLLMVCFYVPLRVGFSVEVPLWSYEFWQDAAIDIYFVVDIIMQFRSAYYDSAGHLIVDTAKIRKHYLRGWFFVDFVCVLPLGYFSYFTAGEGEGEGTSSSFRAVKSLRLLRMGKMMRLAKVYKMLQKYDNVAELKPLISIAGLIFLVFLASHLLACFWFLIGVSDQEMTPQALSPEQQQTLEPLTLLGWVNQKASEDEWWGELGKNATLKTRYITSMYGIFNALENGFTDSEKVFAILAELVVGSVIYGGLAAVLSASMVEAQEASHEFNTNYAKKKAWMTARNLPKNYQKQVLAEYTHKYKDNTSFDEEEMLSDLAPAKQGMLRER